jgi:predicted transcriptional regulator
MARRRSPTLTDTETRLMHVLWARQRATVTAVAAALPRQHVVASNTVQTMLRVLERKGYVSHEQVGRAFVYRPIVERTAARRPALGDLTKSLFDGSPSLLLLNLLEDERLDPTERQRLKQLIAEARSQTVSRYR